MGPRASLIICLLLWPGSGCSPSLDGPIPQVTAVTPTSACVDGRSTLLSVVGRSFSPLEEGTLANSRLSLPAVTLVRALDLDGQPQQDRLPVPGVEGASDVQLVNSLTLAVTLCPPGVCAALTPPHPDLPALPSGLYGVQVTNPTGGSATLASGFTLVPPPVLASVTPASISRKLGDTVTLAGDYLLELAGKPPTVTVAGMPFTLNALTDCRPLPAAAGVTLSACRRATLTLPLNTFAVGPVSIALTGPTPLDCGTATVTLTVKP